MIKIENFNDVADCETIVSDEYKNCQAVTNLNEKKIGLNPGNDKAYFICQYDVPSSVSDNLIHTGIFGARRRSLF